jgi:hypothetical protein
LQLEISDFSHPASNEKAVSMSELKDFEEMEVWQDARALAVAVYTDFTSVKDFSFCDQIIRAVVSISNNTWGVKYVVCLHP